MLDIAVRDTTRQIVGKRQCEMLWGGSVWRKLWETLPGKIVNVSLHQKVHFDEFFQFPVNILLHYIILFRENKK